MKQPDNDAFNLERAIADWRQEMAAAGIQAPADLAELEGHLREDVDKASQSGLSLQQAFEAAVQHIGPTASLGLEFKKEEKARRRLSRKHLFFGVAAGSVAVGSLCYLVILPLALRANAQYASWLGIPQPQPDTSFFFRLALGFCLGLAMPVGIVVLARQGILNARRLSGFRVYIIVANFILAAVLTTPEAVTQILMFVLLQLFCELGILLTRTWEKADADS